MVLPLLGALMGPSLLGSAGLGLISSPLLAGAVGSGIGAALQGEDLEGILGAGLGTYLGGSLMGGAGAAGADAGGPIAQSAWTPEAATPGLFGTGGGIGNMLSTGYNALGTGGPPRRYRRSRNGWPNTERVAALLSCCKPMWIAAGESQPL